MPSLVTKLKHVAFQPFEGLAVYNWEPPPHKGGALGLAASTAPAVCCPHCQSRRFVGFGTTQTKVFDIPAQNQVTTLLVTHPRHRCSACGKTFVHRSPELHPTRNLTRRLFVWLKNAYGKGHSYAELAAATGLSENTVKNACLD